MASSIPRLLAAPWLARQVRQNIGSLRGVEMIPQTGSIVIAPNHTSYLDHFIIDFLFGSIRHVPTWFLTKQESFQKLASRLWTESWHGIPVDRDQTSSDTIRRITQVLNCGDSLCVYPEGTRNTSQQPLLSFKAGAFHFAASANVPVVPVAVSGAQHVLQKGRWRFNSGRINVAVGEPIWPDLSLTKRDRIARLMQEWETQMLQLLSQTKDTPAHTTIHVASYIEQSITGSLDPAGNLVPSVNRDFSYLLGLLLNGDPMNAVLLAQKARLRGLAAARKHSVARALGMRAARRDLERVMRMDPSDTTVRYYLGTLCWLASTFRSKRVLTAAREHFENARGPSSPVDQRARIGLARTLIALHEPLSARDELEHAASLHVADDPRAPARREKIARMLASLDHAS